MSACEHRWVAKTTEPASLYWQPGTRILFVCSHCGTARVDRLEGTWAVKDLIIESDSEATAASAEGQAK